MGLCRGLHSLHGPMLRSTWVYACLYGGQHGPMQIYTEVYMGLHRGLCRGLCRRSVISSAVVVGIIGCSLPLFALATIDTVGDNSKFHVCIIY